MQKNKEVQLGMPLGTANNRLKKNIMFDLVKKCGEDICYRCKEKILTVEEFSVEHKENWLNNNPELFWDLNNITFSHLKCNVSHKNPRVTHGSARYNIYGCRCNVCKQANTEKKRKQRSK
jgi:hypothetical protein